jgi:hypothetical protein
MQTPERRSPVRETCIQVRRCVWLLDLKRAEQNRGDKGEYGEHSHHVKSQGKVHVATPFLAQKQF